MSILAVSQHLRGGKAVLIGTLWSCIYISWYTILVARLANLRFLSITDISE